MKKIPETDGFFHDFYKTFRKRNNTNFIQIPSGGKNTTIFQCIL